MQASRKTKNLSSHIDLHTHAGSGFYKHVTLTFELFTSRSMHAEVILPSVPSLVLSAYVVFVLEHGKTDTHTHTDTDSTDILLTY